MTIEFDQQSRLAAIMQTHPGGGSDWHGLRSRLAAAHAARAAFGLRKARAAAVAGGSFDSDSARVLAALTHSGACGLGAINPTALSSGKSDRGKDAAVAGAHEAGD
jgi:hypothetical protein